MESNIINFHEIKQLYKLLGKFREAKTRGFLGDAWRATERSIIDDVRFWVKCYAHEEMDFDVDAR